MSDNPNVDERTPATPVALADIGQQLLDEAGGNANGRSALTLTPAQGGPLKQTLLAIKAGQELTEHPAPGPATIQVLEGTAIVTGAAELRIGAGQWAPIPEALHGVRAEDDVVALLTVVTRG